MICTMPPLKNNTAAQLALRASRQRGTRRSETAATGLRPRRTTHPHAAAEGRAAGITHAKPRLRASLCLAGRRRLANARLPGGQPTPHCARSGRRPRRGPPPWRVRIDVSSICHAAAAPRRPRSPGGATARSAGRTSAATTPSQGSRGHGCPGCRESQVHAEEAAGGVARGLLTGQPLQGP
jgi:hypothetical protein